MPDGGFLTQATSIVRRAEIIETEIDGEIIALDVKNGNYYGLNKVGSRVWQLAITLGPVSAICEALQNEYDVPEPVCERTVLALLEALHKEGLIDVLNPGGVSDKV